MFTCWVLPLSLSSSCFLNLACTFDAFYFKMFCQYMRTRLNMLNGIHEHLSIECSTDDFTLFCDGHSHNSACIVLSSQWGQGVDFIYYKFWIISEILLKSMLFLWNYMWKQILISWLLIHWYGYTENHSISKVFLICIQWKMILTCLIMWSHCLAFLLEQYSLG